MFFRAVSCIVLSAKEGSCENCLHEQKLCFKKIKQREIYKSTVQEEPLSRILLNVLDGRILSTLQSNQQSKNQRSKKVYSINIIFTLLGTGTAYCV